MDGHDAVTDSAYDGPDGERSLRALRRSGRRLPAGLRARRGADDRALPRRPDHADAARRSASRPASCSAASPASSACASSSRRRGHRLVVTSDKDGPDSVFERELPEAEVVISQPFWPAYLTAERIAKAPKLKLALTAGHRLRPRRPAGGDRARPHRRRGHLLEQHQRRRARGDDDPGAGPQLHPLLPVGGRRAAGTSPTASRAPTTSRGCRSARSPPGGSARRCCGG